MADEPTPPWSGINHLALVTNDMDATVRFYHGVLGARLVATIGAGGFRHYFFSFGPQCTVAFFEYRDHQVPAFAKPAGVPDARAIQFDHLSLNLPDDEALLDLRRRLKAADCEVTDVVDHSIIHSIYFTDNNGIALEASAWTLDVTAIAHAEAATGELDFGDRRRYADETPVAAVAELAEGGLRSTPSTRLV